LERYWPRRYWPWPAEPRASATFSVCQDLTSAQRRNLGFRPNRKAPRVVPPPGEVFWRKILRRVDPSEIAQALDRWRLSQKEEVPGLLSIDGKVIGNNLATLVSLVDATDGSPLNQAAAPGNGQEQKLADSLIAALPDEALEGKTVSGDALYCQKDLTPTIVQEKADTSCSNSRATKSTPATSSPI
jgi:hypothetical protein